MLGRALEEMTRTRMMEMMKVMGVEKMLKRTGGKICRWKPGPPRSIPASRTLSAKA
jgi:hypothetical protein